MIAWSDTRDTGADVLHDSGALVTKDDWHRCCEIPTNEAPVAVADAGGSDPHKHLAGPRWIKDEILDRERGARRMEYRGSHSHTTPVPPGPSPR